MHKDTIFQEKKIAVIETVESIRKVFLECIHFAQIDPVMNFFVNEFHLHDKLVSLHNLLGALITDNINTEHLNTLSDVVYWVEYHNMIYDELNRIIAPTRPKHKRIESTDHIEDFRKRAELADRLLFENTKKVTAKEFILKHLAELNVLIKHCSNKKQALVEFARKHGFEFDATHLLRTLNEANLQKKRGAKSSAK